MASELIAYCGLYCGACSFKVAFEEKNKEHVTSMPSYYDRLKDEPVEFCPGCRLENICGECAMRDCAISKEIEHCGQCGDFPCDKVSSFNNDGKPHHGEAINNLNLLRELGEEKWLEHMKDKWTCKCGTRFSWYYQKCPRCEA